MKYIKNQNKIYSVKEEVIDKTTMIENLKKNLQSINSEKEEKLRQVNDFFKTKENDIKSQIEELENL